MSNRPLSHQEKLKHLYSRACFGMSAEQAFADSRAPIKEHVGYLLEQAKDPEALNAVHEHLLPRTAYRDMSEEEIRAFGRARQRHEESVNLTWMLRLCTTDKPFLEKMTLFWHGHFACRNGNGWFLQQLNDVHREHALGNFRDMVLSVSRTPAMLSFLNNQQNRKSRPNENFARELLELFTIGVGNYKESDVKAAARAFTGWRYSGRHDPAFNFNQREHDSGLKTFLGDTGKFGGADIIDIILRRRKCANFLATKLYAFFVSDEPNPHNIEQLARVIFSSDYSMQETMEYLLTADWFYARENVGNLIKSPVELIVGLSRQFNVRYDEPNSLLRLQRSLGQALFYPPNVAGWPGGQKWIDSSSLMARMKMPSTVLNGGVIEIQGKIDPEDEAFVALLRREQRQVNRRLRTQADWKMIEDTIPAGTTDATLAKWLIATPLSPKKLALIRSNSLKGSCLQLVSMPEYQLC